MIPRDSEELDLLAGEYVLGVLEPGPMREVETASRTNAELARALAYWEERLAGLSRLAPPAEPPAGLWERIRQEIERPEAVRRRVPLWNCLGFWRGATGVAAALAACLALYIALAPTARETRFVAVLHAPQQEPAAWVATMSGNGLLLHQVAASAPPGDKAFELWSIPPGGVPQALGVIPAGGAMEIGSLADVIQDGGMLAISIEPKTGSPSGQPTGPVVFVGRVNAVR
jgi:anti-sigma-K factor RskA